MFESNSPVDRFGCDYVALWNAFKRLATAYSADEKMALFSGTATRVYRIDSLPQVSIPASLKRKSGSVMARWMAVRNSFAAIATIAVLMLVTVADVGKIDQLW
jgi:hypothetical protein